MKHPLMLAILIFLNQAALAKLSITLTSAGRNPIGVYVSTPSKNLTDTIRHDINISGWLQATQQLKDGIRSYNVQDRCLHKATSSKPIICVQGSMSEKKLAHIMADSIFEDITGKKSWFSSRIALITSDMKGYKNRHYRLEVTDSSGENSHTVFSSPSPIMSPVWSPDGQSIAYVSFEKGKASIWKQNLKTGSRLRLSDAKGINGAPRWSPDQQQMALVLSTDGIAKLHLLNLTTSTLRPLTKGASLDTEPCWHPDGRSIFYTSSHGGNPQIYQLNLANGQSTRVTFFGDYNATPSLSKDGKRLATLTRHGGRYMVVVHDLSTGTHQILSAKGNEEQPMIHEGGEAVLFGIREGERMQIAMAQVNTPSRYQLPTDQGWARFPSWSPSLT